MRWLRDLDWSWRRFGGSEWVLIVAAACFAVTLPVVLAARDLNGVGVGGIGLVLVGRAFVHANRQRRAGVKPTAGHVATVVGLALVVAVAAVVVAGVVGPGA